MLNKKGRELSVLLISAFEWEILCAYWRTWLWSQSGCWWVTLSPGGTVMAPSAVAAHHGPIPSHTTDRLRGGVCG